MPDNLGARSPQDRARVNTSEPWEVRYWTEKWNVTEQQLRDAVAKVGVSTKALAEHFGKTLED